jgi:protein associated with RNAse G/E
MVEETYSKGKSAANRLWNFKFPDWRLAPFLWHTNRLLILYEPDQFYSIRLFWEEKSNAFIGYYINFELPVTRTPFGVDTMDLELDIDIEPDLSFHWKDQDEYQRAVDHGLILPEWVRSIEEETPRILGRLENHKYPFDGCWLHWMPDPNWRPPKLPEGWDQL